MHESNQKLSLWWRGWINTQICFFYPFLREGEKGVVLIIYSMVGWLNFMACQPLGYFILKIFLSYSFFVGYDCYLYSYLYIISGDISIDNWMFSIVVCVQLLLYGEVSISVEGLYIQDSVCVCGGVCVCVCVCVTIWGWNFALWMLIFSWRQAFFRN